MKYKLLISSFIFLAVFLFAAPLHTAHADDVVIATQSGATYLTTTTTTISTTSAVTPVATPVATTSGTGTPIITKIGTFFLPVGFFSSVSQLVNNIFKIIMVVAVILVFAYLVLGGMQYITSGGEKGKTEAARNKIIAAIVGLIIVASSYAILTLVLQFIGYTDSTDLLNVGIPTVKVTPTPTPTSTTTSPLQELLK